MVGADPSCACIGAAVCLGLPLKAVHRIMIHDILFHRHDHSVGGGGRGGGDGRRVDTVEVVDPAAAAANIATEALALYIGRMPCLCLIQDQGTLVSC